MPSAVLIPIKSFDLAKGRLGDAVAPEHRSELARHMAATVIKAGRELDVWVVCGDHAVADFARANGARVIWRAPRGLNAAIEEGTQALAARGIDRVIIAHADLPRATDLSIADAADDSVVLVPDRHNDGSNVLSIPLGRGFSFHYGPGSAAAHRAEAERCGLPLRNVQDEALSWDVDVPDDLDALDLPALLGVATPADLAPTHPTSSENPT